ncbi:MAG: hypothetical protein LBN39_03915 [Planctomycetaceae bacterium]|nr:hypothetical protein [Planctomycetaceae bacterium]
MKRYLFFAALFFVLTTAVFSAETVRVGSRSVSGTRGVPQILVDGQPVRSRMFFGNPGSLPIAIGTEAKRYSFDFQPVESEPKTATMHIRLDAKPQTVLFDDILLEELDADGKTQRNVFGTCKFDNGQDDFKKEWTFYPQGTANTTGTVSVESTGGIAHSGALKIQITAPKDGNYPDFHVFHFANLALDQTKKYRLTFWAKSDTETKLRLAFYRPGTHFVFLGGIGHDFFKSQIELAGKAGAPFVSFSIGLPWAEPGKENNFDSVDEACKRVLAANPDALLIPRIPTDPPTWWVEANPDDVITWRGTPHEARKVAAVSSLKYRKEAAERLDVLVRHLEETFPKNIAGYHPCGQNTGEWFYQDSWGPALNGYAEADGTAWNFWQQKRNIVPRPVPSPELRLSKTGGVFRDVAVEKEQQAILDFAGFQQEMMADTVLTFAKTVREASKGKHLVVFFYGYGFEFGALQTGPATSGHYALRKVLASPDMDILCSPISYFDRQKGGSAPAMSAAESVALAGKLWLYEDDTRTHLTPRPFTFPGGEVGADTQGETVQLLLRNTGECAVRNFGTWWMDLGTAAWFDDPVLWEQMKKLETLDKLFLGKPQIFEPEVAVFLDEKSMLAVAAGGQTVSIPAVYKIRESLARMGTPYGQYLLDDFLNGKVKTKLNVFANAWLLSKEQRKQLKEKAEASGTVNIWCYAPGFLDAEKGGAIENVEELTGFKVRPIENVNAWAEPTEYGKQLGLQTGFGIKQPVKPLFTVTDTKPDEVLAAYPDGSPAAVICASVNGSTSIFAGVPGVNSQLLRLAARKAKVHLFTEQDCNVYANGNAVVLHGAADSGIDVHFKQSGKIVDLLSDKTLGNDSKITVPLKLGETKIILIPSE